MNSLRRLLGFVASAAMLAAFALPASAAGTKLISFPGFPSPLLSGTTNISATITNTGNSNANSFAVEWPTSPSFTVNGVATANFATGGSSTGICSVGGSVLRGPLYSRCIFNNQIPLKVNKSVTITLNVTVTNNACTSPPALDWVAYAWTGSPGPASTSFELSPPGPRYTAFPPASCSITFEEQPEDAFIGYTITGEPFNSESTQRVKVKLAPAPAVGTSVFVSDPDCGIEESKGFTDAGGYATFTPSSDPDTTLATTEGCQLEAKSYPYPSAFSQELGFKVVLPATGRLDCPGGVNDNTFGAGAGDFVVDGTRLDNVVDPEEGPEYIPDCEVVPYTVSTTCPAGVPAGTVSCTDFTYDPLGQGSHMAFLFTWEWPIETPLPPGGIGAIEKTGQLFINGNDVAPFDLDLCQGTIAVYEPEGDPEGDFVELIADPLYLGPEPHPWDQSNAPGTQAGCLISQDVIQVGTGFKLVQKAWVQGDYTATRR